MSENVVGKVEFSPEPSEAVRRANFFAKYEAFQRGHPVITLEDLTRGLARESKDVARLVKCLNGEHERETTAASNSAEYMEHDDDCAACVFFTQYIEHGVAFCKHCRCLYVEKT